MAWLFVGPRGRIRQHVQRPAVETQRINPRPVEPVTATDLIHQPNPQFVADPAHTSVQIPEAHDAIVTSSYAGAPVLSQPALVVGRELEMMNIFLVSEVPFVRRWLSTPPISVCIGL